MGWVRVDEIYKGNITNRMLIDEAKTKPWWKNISDGVADPSRSDLIQEWGEEGVTLYRAENDVDKGIEHVKNVLRPVLGNPKAFFNRNYCRATIREFKSYRIKNGRIVKEDDHAMDEIRYFLMKECKEDGLIGGSVDFDVTEYTRR